MYSDNILFVRLIFFQKVIIMRLLQIKHRTWMLGALACSMVMTVENGLASSVSEPLPPANTLKKAVQRAISLHPDAQAAWHTCLAATEEQSVAEGRYMPKLDEFFHYRSIDVSTLKELAERWAPEIKAGFSKESSHQALDDIIESIEELRYYRQHLMKC
jgi:oligoribonuclease (3'-5' exoribonuclease)